MTPSYPQALSSNTYDAQWQALDDFIRFNPGARHRRRLILKILNALPFNTLLDAGCGPGELLLFLAKHLPPTTQLFGADFALETLKQNQVRMPAIPFQCLDLQAKSISLPTQAPWPSEGFDVVVCSEVIEHLENPAQAFAHLASMVKPGGWLLLTCPTGTRYPTEVHFGHLHHPTPKFLEEQARCHRLQIQKLQNWGWPFYRMLKVATNLNPDWALRNFGSGQYSLLKKGLNHALYAANFLNVPHSAFGCQLVALFHKATSHEVED